MSSRQGRFLVAGDVDLRWPRERGARFVPARWSESDAPPLYDPSRLRRGDGAFLDRRPAPPRNVTRGFDLRCAERELSSRFCRRQSQRIQGGMRVLGGADPHPHTTLSQQSRDPSLCPPPAPDPRVLSARPLPNAGGKRAETGRLINSRQGQGSPKLQDRREGSATDIQP
jgi:hypothetical protein